MDVLKDILAMILEDPETIQQLSDLIVYGLGVLGVSGTWIAMARKLVDRIIPLLVIKVLVAKIKNANVNIGDVVNIGAKDIIELVRSEVGINLPKAIASAYIS